MTSWVARDAAVIAGAEKVRFFSRAAVHGKGSILTTESGEQLIDLSATWTAAGLGYADPRVAQAVSAVMLDCPGDGLGSLTNPQSVRLAERLIGVTSLKADENRVYFGHSGSDANDVAIRLCRRNSPPTRQRVIAFEHSYHGGLGESLGFSGVQVEGGAERDRLVSFLPYPDLDHPHGLGFSPADELGFVLAAAAAELRLGDACAVIVEPILSDGGMILPPDGFLSGLRRLCDEFSVPLICDEVKVGLARPGTMHAFDHDGIRPDLVTFGKALGGGLPISAIVGDARLLDSPAGSALLTMGGNPVSCAAGLAVLDAIESDNLVGAAATKGRLALDHLHGIVGRLEPAAASLITHVRGRGLAIGVEIGGVDAVQSSLIAGKVVYRLAELGVVVYYVGGHVLEITPALTIPEDELIAALDVIGTAVADVCAGAVSDDAVRGYGGW